MKYKIIFLLSILINNVSSAQNIKNIFAFKHTIPMGNIPRFQGKSGNPAPETSEHTEQDFIKYTHYIFVEMDSNVKPNISKLIVENKKYTFKVVKIDSLPFVYSVYDGVQEQKITLVPKGKKNIYRLELETTSAVAETVVSKNELQISYKIKGAIKTKTCNKFKVLPSAVMP